ncbi:MAG: FecCD family ABC transporter permease [Phycisphaerales bacterium]
MKLSVFGLVAILACLVRLLVGGESLGWPGSSVILELRVNRVLAGAAVGAGLAIAGVLLQSLLRNPLAAPDLLGLSAGAGFAVTLFSLLTGAAVGVASSAVPALLGAVVVLGFIWILSQRRGLIDPITMILIGVILAVLLGSGASLLRSLMPDQGQSAARWMMGSISDSTGRATIWGVWAMVGVVGVQSWWMGRRFDASSLGQDEARSSGVPVRTVRVVQLVGAGALTAGTIVLAGPIGFVGLVCPHAARMILGPSHRGLIVGAACAGVALVVGADALVKAMPGPAGRIPVGVITSLIGGPVFLVILLRSRRTWS